MWLSLIPLIYMSGLLDLLVININQRMDSLLTGWCYVLLSEVTFTDQSNITEVYDVLNRTIIFLIWNGGEGQPVMNCLLYIWIVKDYYGLGIPYPSGAVYDTIQTTCGKIWHHSCLRSASLHSGTRDAKFPHSWCVLYNTPPLWGRVFL